MIVISRDGADPIRVVSLAEGDSTMAEGRMVLQPAQHFSKKWQQYQYSSLLQTFKEKLQKIAERKDDWDGKGSKKPSILALSQAHILLDGFLSSIIDNGRIWASPFVSSDEDGHITIQWNSGDHELHIDVSEQDAEYIKVWGLNIEKEMHLGILGETKFLTLWDWLNE